MDNRTKNIVYSLVLFALMGIVWMYRQNNPPKPTHFYAEGKTMGTSYHIKYIDPEGRALKSSIDSLLVSFNQSLSTYIPDSEISTFNKGEEWVFKSGFFLPVLERSLTIYKHTEKAFDPTVMPLVRAWGFGPDAKLQMDSAKVDSLLHYVGFDKITFDEQKVVKLAEGVQLDFSALAKGYGVDVVADYLSGLGIEDYMVEIGGEVACKGKNERGKAWSIGVDNPKYAEEGGKRATAVVQLSDRALATSGNYRNFYVKDGKKYAHTIDPRTGFPVQHSLLSASVFAVDCMTADAYATSFMVMGKDKAIKLLEADKDLDALLIYEEGGEIKVYMTDGVKGSLL